MAETVASVGLSVNKTPAFEARQVFNHELKPAVATIQKAEDFQRALYEYKTGLNSAVENGFVGSIQASASSLLANINERNRLEGLESDEANKQAIDDINKEIRRDVVVVYAGFQENFGGVTTLLSQYLPDEQTRALFQETVATNLAHWIAVKTGLGKHQTQNAEMTRMAQFLLTHSPHFRSLQEKQREQGLEFSGATWEENEDIIESLMTVAKTEEEVARLDPKVMAFELRRWLATTAKEARVGKKTPEGKTKKRKIYETPYYRGILKELHRLSKRRNGVGGVILYGPPGTGKTELVQEKNEQQGYETHVVSIHHYTSFADLLADKAITLRTDLGAPLAQKLDTVISYFKGKSPEEFGRAMTTIYTALQSSGKLGQDQQLSQFLLPYLSLDQKGVIDLLAKSSFSTEDWQHIQNAFFAKQEARLLRTSLDPSHQETMEDIVRGEILLAIRKSKGTGRKIRVLLDEIDKAGPNSLGGLLTFLAKSPGETITIGEVTEEIPSWFVVDATSNSLELNEYLTDRFSHLEVGTPPPKDQLMIAGVRLSDDEGNIQLTPYEQEQLVGFFVYVLPRINALLSSAKVGWPPISNRGIQELTGNLVDFSNMQRTNLSVSEAVRRLLLENKMWARDPKLRTKLEDMLDIEFAAVLRDEPIKIKRRGTPVSQEPANLGQRYNQALEGTITSPMITAINGLADADTEVSGHKTTIEEVTLNETQQSLVRDFLAYERGRMRGLTDIYPLPIGFIIQERTEGERANLQLISVPNDRKVHLIHSQPVPIGRIAGASYDGTVIVLSSELDKDSDTLRVIRPFDTKGGESNEGQIKKGETAVDRTGTYIAQLNPSDNLLLIFRTDNIQQSRGITGVEDFQFSSDGKLILVKKQGGGTWVHSSSNLASIIDEPLDQPDQGYEWKFVGNHMLLQVPKDEQNAVKNLALYVA
ncbi:AAA family ATPase [Candidatus Daviesbacteria bacterium]|nr:AAA family ATPase [Candidatus Daviesbacteria bacterium]